ncbi:MAG: hypothetical protein V4621_04165 [Pseudomonadota bacterium]
MLEAIAMNVANAAYLRVEAQKLSPQPVPVRPMPAVKASVSAPYYSPYVIVDESSSKAILAMRDSATGNITRQFPTDSQIRAYQRVEAMTTAIRTESRVDAPEVASTLNRPKATRQAEDIALPGNNVTFGTGDSEAFSDIEINIDDGAMSPPIGDTYTPVSLDA